MGQLSAGRFARIFLIIFICGCERRSPAPPATRPSITVASLVPAATDLLIGMGAGDHLVAVSNFDSPREETKNLPRVGDYQSIDWEKIAEARPTAMLVFMAPDRMPPAVKENAAKLGIQLVNVKTERLEDVYNEIDKLGELVNEHTKAAAAKEKLKQQLDAVRARVRDLPKVKTLIVRDETALAAVGKGTFIDDCLSIAGGQNVLSTSGYPNIDAEMLASLDPQAVIQLLPDASPQLLAAAKKFWDAHGQLAAVREHRVCVITDSFAQQPGFHLGDLGERFADCLHPTAKAKP